MNSFLDKKGLTHLWSKITQLGVYHLDNLNTSGQAEQTASDLNFLTSVRPSVITYTLNNGRTGFILNTINTVSKTGRQWIYWDGNVKERSLFWDDNLHHSSGSPTAWHRTKAHTLELWEEDEYVNNPTLVLLDVERVVISEIPITRIANSGGFATKDNTSLRLEEDNTLKLNVNNNTISSVDLSKYLGGSSTDGNSNVSLKQFPLLATLASLKSDYNSLPKGGIILYIYYNIAKASQGWDTLSADVTDYLFEITSKGNTRDINNGDIIVMSKQSSLISTLPKAMVIPTQDAKTNVMGLESPWDKQQINKIPNIISQLPIAEIGENFNPGSYNMDDCKEPGIYFKGTTGRSMVPSDDDEHYLLIVSPRKVYGNGYQNALQLAISLKHSGKMHYRYLEFDPSGNFIKHGNGWENLTDGASSNFLGTIISLSSESEFEDSILGQKLCEFASTAGASLKNGVYAAQIGTPFFNVTANSFCTIYKFNFLEDPSDTSKQGVPCYIVNIYGRGEYFISIASDDGSFFKYDFYPNTSRVDTELNDNSNNTVTNSAITKAINDTNSKVSNKVDKTATICVSNGKTTPMTSDNIAIPVSFGSRYTYHDVFSFLTPRGSSPHKEVFKTKLIGSDEYVDLTNDSTRQWFCVFMNAPSGNFNLLLPEEEEAVLEVEADFYASYVECIAINASWAGTGSMASNIKIRIENYEPNNPTKVIVEYEGTLDTLNLYEYQYFQLKGRPNYNGYRFIFTKPENELNKVAALSSLRMLSSRNGGYGRGLFTEQILDWNPSADVMPKPVSIGREFGKSSRHFSNGYFSDIRIYESGTSTKMLYSLRTKITELENRIRALEGREVLNEPMVLNLVEEEDTTRPYLGPYIPDESSDEIQE